MGMMRSISRFTVLAALVGIGLPAHASSQPSPTTQDTSSLSTAATPAAPDGSTTDVMAPPRITVAAIMVEASQALLWDTIRREYVVVRLGDTYQQFRVTALDSEQVVLSRGNQHYVLPRTSDTSDLTRRRQVPIMVASQTVQVQDGLVDPYGSSTGALSPASASTGAPITGTAPVDPYSLDARAPVDPYAPGAGASVPAAGSGAGVSGSPAVMDPYAAGPVAPSLPSSLLTSRVDPLPDLELEPSKPASSGSTPRVTAMPRPVVQSQGQAQASSAREERHTVSRKEFDAAVADFHALSNEVKVALVADGVRVDHVAAGSLPHRMGIRTGDVVLTVDGKRLRNMNDAATVYARLMDAERFTIKLRRRDGTVSMRYRFTR